ncbi:MAG: zinc ribbon domain-containing protein [Candidatus Stahlbacteria bacterium]|jgi:putative FmdB family regulatory protein|nr:zinc ribbon domain-containing protein [candidate division WOR-3 bacterium]TEU01027.1 MAG: zinc ribbon domain-containing protein [Candidatus Stahlbacteria bacterium]
MPTYEYECMECGHRFEKFQGIKDKSLKKCPKCGGRVKRLIGTGTTVIFKGNGFYHTDYKLNASKKDDKKEDKEEDKKANNKGKV